MQISNMLPYHSPRKAPLSTRSMAGTKEGAYLMDSTSKRREEKLGKTEKVKAELAQIFARSPPKIRTDNNA